MKNQTTPSSTTFVLIGAAGYIAPKHLAAIKKLGGKLIAVSDPNDNLEILDHFFPDCEYFKSTSEMGEFLKDYPVDYAVICSPSYLHADHIEMMLQNACDVICESPLVLTKMEYKRVQKAEKITGKNVYNILQYRYYPEIIQLKNSFSPANSYNIEFINHTYRGKWFEQSWKGKPLQSGGILTSLGYHFFEILIWIYGLPVSMEISTYSEQERKGFLQLKNAMIHFSLSHTLEGRKYLTQRELYLNSKFIKFDTSVSDAFIKCYSDILENKGLGIDTVQPIIELLDPKNAW